MTYENFSPALQNKVSKSAKTLRLIKMIIGKLSESNIPAMYKNVNKTF